MYLTPSIRLSYTLGIRVVVWPLEVLRQVVLGEHRKSVTGMTSQIWMVMANSTVDLLEMRMVVEHPTSTMLSPSLKWSTPAILVDLRATDT